MPDIRKLLAETDALLATFKKSPAKELPTKKKTAPVERHEASTPSYSANRKDSRYEFKDHEFFGTHYLTNHPPRHLAGRDPSVKVRIDLFSDKEFQDPAPELITQFSSLSSEVILHRHPPTSGCFANMKCRKL